jgi:thymidylate kinase
MSERGSAPYVHIEGMDLAGKTSATDLFTARRSEDWEIKRNSLSEDNPARNLADAMLDSGEYSVETVGTMYAAALMADFDRFTRPNVPTIQESTIILRSIAYQAVNGTPRLTELFEGMMDRHPSFDASFMLTASHEERMARLAKQERHFSNHDLLIVRDPVKFFAMEALVAALAKKHFQADVIDTSDMPTDKVVETIEQRLRAKAVILSDRQIEKGE